MEEGRERDGRVIKKRETGKENGGGRSDGRR
jgi:hypothetical protein